MQKLLLLITLVTLCSCQHKTNEKNVEKPSAVIEEAKAGSSKKEANSIVDSMIVDKENFTDFFSRFMWNRNFQINRIDFPIQVNNNTVQTKDKWVYNSFYTNKEFIPIIYNDTITHSEKDIEFENVSMSVLDSKSQNCAIYTFIRNAGKWRLQNVSSKNINEILDTEFIKFLIQFSSDSTYQLEHTKFPLPECYVDYDKDYELVNKMKSKSEWKFNNLYKSLDGLMMFNLNIESNFRLLFYQGVENGIRMEYTFSKTAESWQLIKEEDYSM